MMKEWKKVGKYARGTAYACGNRRKLVVPNCPAVYLELDTKKVWWDINPPGNKALALGR